VNQRGSRGLVVLRTAQTAAGAVLLGPLGANLGALSPIVGLAVFAIGGVVGLLNALAALVIVSKGERRRGLGAMLLSAGTGLMLVYSAMAGIGKPPINDISTDLATPPILIGGRVEPENAGHDLGYPESFKAAARSAYPDVRPLRLDDPPDAVFRRALALAQARAGWKIGSVDDSQRSFEGVATSRVFRFRDDFVLRVRADGTGSIVDMRSRSREGKGDLGVNAERIRTFLDALRLSRSSTPPLH
jgi:uncharacterized protein (DUF1499 family)